MRAIWTGSIAFGLVNIPVKIYSATESSSLDLDMLDKKDHSNIRYKRVNEKTNKEVEWENIVKGFKLPNDDYVVLEEEDFEKAAAKKNEIIEIKQFINEDEIDLMYFETPYYLEPQKSGIRAYALLREALKKSGKMGVAVFVMRNKENLCVIKPLDNVLVLERIRFDEEIRTTDELNLPEKSQVKPAEIKMAITLINQLTGKFDITKYKDNYSAELMKLIKAKAKGKKYKTPKLKVIRGKSKGLMDQLKESLQHKKAS